MPVNQLRAISRLVSTTRTVTSSPAWPPSFIVPGFHQRSIGYFYLRRARRCRSVDLLQAGGDRAPLGKGGDRMEARDEGAVKPASSAFWHRRIHGWAQLQLGELDRTEICPSEPCVPTTAFGVLPESTS